jgi:hypothetical protein
MKLEFSLPKTTLSIPSEKRMEYKTNKNSQIFPTVYRIIKHTKINCTWILKKVKLNVKRVHIFM